MRTKVYSTRLAMEAHALKNILLDEGLRADVVGDAAIDLGGGMFSTCEIWIDSQQMDAANRVIADWQNERKRHSSLRSPASFQFGLFGIMLNLTIAAIVCAVAQLPGIDANIIVSIVFGILVANLMYIARFRRDRQRFANEMQNDD